MEKLAGYQHAAEIIVQLVYALVGISVLVAAAAVLWIFFGKRADNSRHANGDQNGGD
jgi:uncharacterized membrane protein YuzA (DUF378 family)